MSEYPRKVPSKNLKKRKRGQDSTSRVKKQDTAPRYCEICGYSTVIHLHRIHPGKERNTLWPNGGSYVLGNTARLCPNHHAEADLGLISKSELWNVVQHRIDAEGRRHLQDVRTLPHVRVLYPKEAKVVCEREEKEAAARPRTRTEEPSGARNLPAEELSGEGGGS